ncbi:MAG: deoxyguanosinetriphosphate triphosphohydrolase [Solirubrobacteraceae bacterium]
MSQQRPADGTQAGFAERIVERERVTLLPLAAPSYPATRRRPEEDCSLRTPFQRDRDRIVHSKAFRRLMHKTQVFIAPLGDHYRTRLTHTLEATGISRTVARALQLNEDLTEAIGMGHDLGHPPFAHIGEEVLDECLKERFGPGFQFHHNEQSLRVVDQIERDGAGLNLTDQVRDGIIGHSSRAPLPATLEGRIVRVMDRVAYINHDIDDAVRAGLLHERDLPAEPIAVLGRSGAARIDALVHDMVEQSAKQGDIVQGAEAEAAMLALREFMFERVYLGAEVTRERARIERVIRRLFAHYAEHPELIGVQRGVGEGDGAGPAAGVEAPAVPAGGDRELAQAVIDYIAGMTDRFCIAAFTELEVPRAFAL